jgi:NADH dehydrogenase
MIRVVLVSSGSVILPELKEKLGRYAQRKLTQRGIEVCTNVQVRGATDQCIELSDGRRIVSNTLIWTAGNSVHPLLAALACQKDRGRIVVDPFFEIPGWKDVYAVGDCASLVDSVSGKPRPPTAQHAVREGKTLARNLMSAIDGRTKRPFRFSTLAQLATIGRRIGVANVLGINFSGFIAWWLWRTVYLMKLPRLEKKIRVALGWTLDLIFTKDIIRHHPLRSRHLQGDEAGRSGSLREEDRLAATVRGAIRM